MKLDIVPGELWKLTKGKSKTSMSTIHWIRLYFMETGKRISMADLVSGELSKFKLVKSN